MIVGRGLIATAFDRYRAQADVTLFCSGVSNSLEQNPKAFFREQKLLKQTLKNTNNALFVYFGTCSVYDPSTRNSAYVQHKLKMEKIVSESGRPYIIFRIPQIVGSSANQSTLLNYLYEKISNENSFELWAGAVRYLVDIDDVVQFVSFVIDDVKKFCVVINLITLPCKVIDIVKIIEKITGKKAKYTLVDTGVSYSIPVEKTSVSVYEADITVDKNYVNHVLRKYYQR